MSARLSNTEMTNLIHDIRVDLSELSDEIERGRGDEYVVGNLIADLQSIRRELEKREDE